jgi:hypothetical protein
MHVQVVGAAVCRFEHRGSKGEQKRDGTVQVWGQKTFRAIKLKISREQTWDSASLRKPVLSKVLKNCEE